MRKCLPLEVTRMIASKALRLEAGIKMKQMGGLEKY